MPADDEVPMRRKPPNAYRRAVTAALDVLTRLDVALAQGEAAAPALAADLVEALAVPAIACDGAPAVTEARAEAVLLRAYLVTGADRPRMNATLSALMDSVYARTARLDPSLHSCMTR